MFNQRGFADYLWIIWGVVVLLGVGGWIANVVKFIHMIDGGVTGMFIARVVGIFAPPLGAILGFF